MKKEEASATYGIGTIIAICISWSMNHSVLWCIIHALFGWFYVIYWLGGCGHKA